MLDKLNNIPSSHYLCIAYTPHRQEQGHPVTPDLHAHAQAERLLQQKQATIATPAKLRKPEAETCIVHAICTNVTVCVGQENFEREGDREWEWEWEGEWKGECVALYGLKHGCNC